MKAKNPCCVCKYANWDRTKAGRLHPSGDGFCQWKMPEIKLPIAFYFFTPNRNTVPDPHGGHISRNSEFDDCPAFEQSPAKKED